MCKNIQHITGKFTNKLKGTGKNKGHAMKMLTIEKHTHKNETTLPIKMLRSGALLR